MWVMIQFFGLPEVFYNLIHFQKSRVGIKRQTFRRKVANNADTKTEESGI